MITRYVLCTFCLLLQSCGGSGGSSSKDKDTPPSDDVAAFAVSSSGVNADGQLDQQYSCDGEGISLPVSWQQLPEQSQSLALIMTDVSSGATHWLLYDIPASSSQLLAATVDMGSLGLNAEGSQGYFPPCSTGTQQNYRLSLYALSTATGMPTGSDISTVQTAISSLILATAELSLSYLATSSSASSACEQKSAAFAGYSDLVSTQCDESYLYVTSATGLPEQNPTNSRNQMMVGISAWINRVPIPYGFNWKIPLAPEYYSDTWQSASARGPIAFAVNGVPIFHYDKRPDVDTDPRVYDYRQENDTVLLGELDQCGGHAGQGDDYHYHYAPVCLLDKHDLNQPIAFGLDGIPVYFGTGGSDYYGSGRFNDINNLPANNNLDDCNAQADADGSFAYYTTATVPYVLGCHRAAVDDSLNMNVPSLQGRSFGDVQPNGELAGEPSMTVINSLSQDGDGWHTLTYDNGARSVKYKTSATGNDCWDFQWSDAADDIFTYCR